MRGRLPDMPAIGRAVGFALVAAAIVAATLHFREHESQGLEARPAVASSPLTEELQRCQAVAARAEDDAACEAAWAESRRRFFTYDPPLRDAAPAPASQKSSGR
jgi:conjugative transfer region protein TrbK